MNPLTRSISILRLLGMSLIVTACQLFPFNATPPAVTETIPTDTALAQPTPTQRPTRTPIPTVGPHSFPGGSIGDPFSPELGNTGYDVLSYTIQIKLDPAILYQTEALVTLTAVAEEGGLEEFSLDFIGFEIDQVLVDGQVAEYRRDLDKLIIEFPASPAKGAEFTTVIAYHGVARPRVSRFVPFISALGMFFPDTKTMFIASEPDGARFWFPNNDHPRDKALFRMEITVPAGMTGVSNGLLQSHTTLASGEELYIWEHNAPMATYLATIAVGEYQRIETRSPDGVLIRDYVLPAYMENAELAFSITGEALDWMSDLFGPYPFEAYGHVVVIEDGFALETQTMSTMAFAMLQENVVIHELAHQWFGNWVSLDSWGEMWRSEGFGTYMEIMWEYRDDPDGYDDYMGRVLDSVNNSPSLEPLNGLSPGNLFGYETYVKGAAVLHALRVEIGEEAFFGGLRLYIERFGGATASDADFQDVMEETSGQNLDTFFAKWLGNEE